MAENIKENTEQEFRSEVKIADEVIAVIAGLAATEVDGVSCMAGNMTHELIAKLGMKNLSKGVSLEIEGKKAAVNLSIVIDYGVNIREVSKKVQERVRAAIENMTGFEVSAVNINISGMAE